MAATSTTRWLFRRASSLRGSKILQTELAPYSAYSLEEGVFVLLSKGYPERGSTQCLAQLERMVIRTPWRYELAIVSPDLASLSLTRINALPQVSETVEVTRHSSLTFRMIFFVWPIRRVPKTANKK